MKKNFIYLAMAAAVLMTACNRDNLQNPLEGEQLTASDIQVGGKIEIF